jgi:probable phosphoglycerate mutase
VRTVYVVAHPAATHHVEPVVGGWHDSALTAPGERAAVSIAQALRATIPDGADVEAVLVGPATDLADGTRGERPAAGGPVLDSRLREKSDGEGRP